MWWRTPAGAFHTGQARIARLAPALRPPSGARASRDIRASPVRFAPGRGYFLIGIPPLRLFYQTSQLLARITTPRDLISTLRARQPSRAQSYCRFVRPLIHFTPYLRIDSVPLFLKRQCDPTVQPGRAGEPSPDCALCRVDHERLANHRAGRHTVRTATE